MKRGIVKAQSTLEYILILSAIVLIILYAAGRMIKPAVNKSLDDAQKAINDTAKELGKLQ